MGVFIKHLSLIIIIRGLKHLFCLYFEEYFLIICKNAMKIQLRYSEQLEVTT